MAYALWYDMHVPMLQEENTEAGTSAGFRFTLP